MRLLSEQTIIEYDSWADFVGLLAERGVDVERVPEDRRNEVVAAWTYGPYVEGGHDSDQWWSLYGGPWADAQADVLLTEGYGHTEH